MKRKYTIEVSRDELYTLLTGLEDTEYWRAQSHYRGDGHPLEPYHDEEPEEATRCREAHELHDRLTLDKSNQDKEEAMDPNELLKKLLEQCRMLQEKVLDGTVEPQLALSDAILGDEWDPIQVFDEVVTGVQDLNAWIQSGGFLPKSWEGKQVQRDMATEIDSLFRAKVVQTMFPEEDPLRDWDADTLDEIKDSMESYALVPQYFRDAQAASFVPEEEE